jgi:hypothetical protein
MKKWLISLMVPALISTASLSTNAATIQNDYSSVKINNGVITIRKNQPQKEYYRTENSNQVSYREKNDHWGNNRRDRDRREERQSMKERDDARYIINRTASVIVRAQRTARIHHYYAGFAQTVAHQNKARELFSAGRYRDAIFHSLRARKLAMAVIRGNRDNWSGFGRDDREEFYVKIAPRDNDMDVQVDWRKVGKDDAVIRIQFNFNVN